MGMFHSTSGKRGYDWVSPPSPEILNLIPRSIMKQMLKREEELRMSKEYHEEISQSDDLAWIRDVTIKIQDQVLQEFGYKTMAGEKALNYARVQYKDDPEMNRITVYQRQDRSRLGNLSIGSDLPNVRLCTMNGEETTLHDYIKKIQGESGRPLIISAGSITWPPYRLAVDYMNNLQEQFAGVVDFLGVYISEAHAQDEWPLGVKFCYNQPKTLERRLEIANKFVTDFGFKIPMLVDTMDNQFDANFAAWPERFYIVENGKMAMVGVPTNEFGFDRVLLHNELLIKGYKPKSNNIAPEMCERTLPTVA